MATALLGAPQSGAPATCQSDRAHQFAEPIQPLPAFKHRFLFCGFQDAYWPGQEVAVSSGNASAEAWQLSSTMDWHTFERASDVLTAGVGATALALALYLIAYNRRSRVAQSFVGLWAASSWPT